MARIEGKMTVLFTSAGRRVELLRAFRRAYHTLGVHGKIIAADMDPLAAALQVADCRYVVPPLTSTEYLPALVDICRRDRVDLVFPLIDPDISVLASHRDVIEATGARLAVVSRQAAAVAEDKLLTLEFFRRLGLSIPSTWLAGDLDSANAPYPLFVKPRRGSAGKHCFPAANPNDLEFLVRYVPDPIVQEYLPGPEITTDVVCSLDGELLGLVSRQRIEVRSGEASKAVTIYDRAIAEACVRIAQALPAIGPITVQCIMKSGVPHFTEINARFGGGVPLGIAAGVDSPRWLLAKAAGLPVEIPPVGNYRTGLYMTRFDDSFFIDEADHDKMGGHSL